MDWKGGRLRQSKRLNGPLSTKQKTYFARGHNREDSLRDTSGQIALDQPSKAQQYTRLVNLSKSETQMKQSRLEDFRVTAPVAKKLSSMRARKLKPTGQDRLETLVVEPHRRTFEHTKPNLINETDKVREEVHLRAPHSLWGEFDDALLDNPSAEEDKPVPLPSQVDLHVARKNLIKRSDWLKPIKVDPIERNDAQQNRGAGIARRRDLSKGELARIAQRKTHGQQIGRSYVPKLPSRCTELLDSPISIRVGTQLHGATAPEVTQPIGEILLKRSNQGDAIEQPCQDHSPSTESQHSTVMLFDDGDWMLHNYAGSAHAPTEKGGHHGSVDGENTIVSFGSFNTVHGVTWAEEERPLQSLPFQEKSELQDPMNTCKEVSLDSVERFRSHSLTIVDSKTRGNNEPAPILGNTVKSDHDSGSHMAELQHDTLDSTVEFLSQQGLNPRTGSASLTRHRRLTSEYVSAPSGMAQRDSSSGVQSIDSIGMTSTTQTQPIGRLKFVFQRPMRFTPPMRLTSDSQTTMGIALASTGTVSTDCLNIATTSGTGPSEAGDSGEDASDPIES